MLFFLICADEAAGRVECHERGWTQAGVARFFTPDRDDVRIVRRFTDVALLPGGTWMIAGRDYMRNPEREEFDGLVAKGAARWAMGGEPKEPAIQEEPAVAEARAVFNPALAVPTTRDAWPPRTAPELLTGGHRGPRPSRR